MADVIPKPTAVALLNEKLLVTSGATGTVYVLRLTCNGILVEGERLQRVEIPDCTLLYSVCTLNCTIVVTASDHEVGGIFQFQITEQEELAHPLYDTFILRR